MEIIRSVLLKSFAINSISVTLDENSFVGSIFNWDQGLEKERHAIVIEWNWMTEAFSIHILRTLWMPQMSVNHKFGDCHHHTESDWLPKRLSKKSQPNERDSQRTQPKLELLNAGLSLYLSCALELSCHSYTKARCIHSNSARSLL